MRILAGCLLVAAVSVVLPPSSAELDNRYGESDLERFMPRPGIGLAVQYGSDHLTCQVLIEPPQPLVYTKEDVPLIVFRDSHGNPGRDCASTHARQGNWQGHYDERVQ
jgi:hypothetical protein